MHPSTPEGKWVMWEKSTGRRFEAWPIDARGMIASGYAVDDEAAVELAPVEDAGAAPAEPKATADVTDIAAAPKKRGGRPRKSAEAPTE